MDDMLSGIHSGAQAAKDALRELTARLAEVGRSYETALAGASRVTASVNNQLAEIRRLRDSRQLSASDELILLQSLDERYALSAQQRLGLDAQVHEAKLRQLAEEMAAIEQSAARGMAQTDYQAKILAYDALAGRYADNPEALADIERARTQAAEARAYRDGERIASDVWVTGLVESTARILSGQAERFQESGALMSENVFAGMTGMSEELTVQWSEQVTALIEGSGGLFERAGEALGQKLLEGFERITRALRAQMDDLAARSAGVSLSGGGGGGGSWNPWQMAGTAAAQEKRVTVNQVIQSPVASPYEVARATKSALADMMKVWA